MCVCVAAYMHKKNRRWPKQIVYLCKSNHVIPYKQWNDCSGEQANEKNKEKNCWYMCRWWKIGTMICDAIFSLVFVTWYSTLHYFGRFLIETRFFWFCCLCKRLIWFKCTWNDYSLRFCLQMWMIQNSYNIEYDAWMVLCIIFCAGCNFFLWKICLFCLLKNVSTIFVLICVYVISLLPYDLGIDGKDLQIHLN